MIYTENVEIRGRQLVRTYSDAFMIERDGVIYAEAIDPIDSGRHYTESDEPLAADEAMNEDYRAALEEMGCRFDD